MPNELARDATIETVWPHLSHQRPYVSGVLQAMRRCNAQHGDSAVRIGITGTGQKPYYRIVYNSQERPTETVFGSFYDNHDPLEFAFAATNNWSSRTMRFSELLDFYADAIGWKGKRA